MPESDGSQTTRNDHNPSATLGLENLRLGSERPRLQTPMMSSSRRGRRECRGEFAQSISQVGHSPHATSSWRLDPGVPSYQPLNISPLGSTDSAKPGTGRSPLPVHPGTSIYLAKPNPQQEVSATKDLLAFKSAPASGSLNQQAKQSVSLIGKVHPRHVDESIDMPSVQHK